MVHISALPLTNWITVDKLIYLFMPRSPKMKKENNSACIIDCSADIMPVKLFMQCQTLSKSKIITVIVILILKKKKL